MTNSQPNILRSAIRANACDRIIEMIRSAIRANACDRIIEMIQMDPIAILEWLQDPRSSDDKDANTLRSMMEDQQMVDATYTAIADSMAEMDDTRDEADSFNNELETIGVAFREALCAGSEAIVETLLARLERAPRADDDVVRMTALQPDVVAGEPLTEPLINFGVTPLMVFQVADAVSLIIKRGILRGSFNGALTLRTSGVYHGDRVIGKRALFISEAQLVTHAPKAIVEALYDWSIAQAVRRPRFFPGFVGSGSTDAKDWVKLAPTTPNDTEYHVFHCWSETLPFDK